jgi:hypothetical protein
MPAPPPSGSLATLPRSAELRSNQPIFSFSLFSRTVKKRRGLVARLFHFSNFAQDYIFNANVFFLISDVI